MEALFKKAALKLGVDARACTVSRSDVARLQRILAHHEIDLVLDVGANVGNFARYLRLIGYRGEIVCFEPLASAYGELEALALKDPLLELAPRMALGDRNGEITINIAANSESSSVLDMLDSHRSFAQGSQYIGSELVQLSRLDTVAGRYVSGKNTFLKIDAQGYELQVLEGALGLLPQIKGLQLELSFVELYSGEPLYRDVIERVERLGYTLYDMNPNFADPVSGRMLQVDAIFIRESA